jgi:hypothetical protein
LLPRLLSRTPDLMNSICFKSEHTIHQNRLAQPFISEAVDKIQIAKDPAPA